MAVIILLPLATGEILDNNVNIGWWLFFAAFWALITRPRTNTDAILAGLVCLLATGTEPLVALLLPLAAARVFVVRAEPRQEAPVIGLVIGLVYQVIGISRRVSPPSPTQQPTGVSARWESGWVGAGSAATT